MAAADRWDVSINIQLTCNQLSESINTWSHYKMRNWRNNCFPLAEIEPTEQRIIQTIEKKVSNYFHIFTFPVELVGLFKAQEIATNDRAAFR